MTSFGPPLRLLATDLDGTLLRDDLTVSPRTRAALNRLREMGVYTIPVTARQPHGVRLIAEQAGFDGWALCGNGALGIHLGTGEVLFEQHLGVAEQSRLAQALLARQPETVFVSIRQRGQDFVAQQGYAALANYSDHKRDPTQMGGATLEQVLAAPSLKLAARHPRLSPQELLAEVQALGNTGDFAATVSGAPFVEFMAQGISKAYGLEKLCAYLNVAQAEVIAFGDAPNDAEMLAWAGHGVAMAHAAPEARAAAQEIALGNNEDGVALVIERLLNEGRFVAAHA